MKPTRASARSEILTVVRDTKTGMAQFPDHPGDDLLRQKTLTFGANEAWLMAPFAAAVAGIEK